jgi:hypothetical protein
MRLDEAPPCHCCATLREYIAEHLDPGAHLTGDENPITLVQDYDKMFRDEGGSGITAEEMGEYLAELRRPVAAPNLLAGESSRSDVPSIGPTPSSSS